MSEVTHKFGCIPSSARRYNQFARAAAPSYVPNFFRKFSMIDDMPPVYDQGNLGSCTSNAFAGCLEYVDFYDPDLKAHGMQPPKESWEMPSRLFMYRNGREIAWLPVDQDTGLSIGDCAEAIVRYGSCDESLWPYDISKFRDKPWPSVYDAASQHRIREARAVDLTNLTLIKFMLAFHYPVIFGACIDQNFESYYTNNIGGFKVIRTPDPNNAPWTHCLLIVGWDDDLEVFLVRNSWGYGPQGWGENGYCRMPYAYIQNPNLCFDGFTIKGI